MARARANSRRAPARSPQFARTTHDTRPTNSKKGNGTTTPSTGWSSGPLDGREFDRTVFRPALRNANVRDFRFKDLRHTFATRLRMHGRADISSIATLLGHTSTRMSERYAHADDAHLHALVGALDGNAAVSAPSDTKSDTSAQDNAAVAR